MALKLADVVEEMKSVIASGPEIGPRQRADRVLELAVDFLLRALVRDAGQGVVAILRRAPDMEVLTFAYPRHLAHGNALPIDRDSLAGRVMLRREPLVENDVPGEPHKEVFERIPDAEGTIRAIQKMVAAPLLLSSGEAIGVVEVSRAGASLAAAGPDFEPRDAENLGKCCRAFCSVHGHDLDRGARRLSWFTPRRSVG